MKPRNLKIMGLNSFIQQQEIDFSLLTEKSFFGIFGPTGSGKSTILDAITIALYGEISRSSQKKLEFINSFRNDMNLYYEFEMGSIKDRKIYAIERHYKRKKDGGISCDKAILKEIREEGFEILSENSKSVTESIEQIVGLKCDDFTRSVVLPQGRFSDFLKLTKGDRGKMLERILNLEEFGSKMTFKIKGEIYNKKSGLDVIYGALSRYEGLTEEIYEAKKEELKVLLEAESALKIEKSRLEIEYEKFNMIWELQKELGIFEIRQNELLLVKGNIEDKKVSLSKAKEALNVKPFLDNKQVTTQKIDFSGSNLEEISKNYLKTLESVKKTENEYILAYDKKDKELPILIDKESKLREAIRLDVEIIKHENDIELMIKEYHKFKEKSGNIESELKQIQDKKGAALETIDVIDEKLLRLKITPEYRESVIEALGVEKEYNEINSKLSELGLEIKTLGSHIITERVQFEEVTASKIKAEAELKILEDRKESLTRNNPGDNSDLYLLQTTLMEMNNTLSEATRNNDALLRVSSEVKALELNKVEIEQKLESTTKASKNLEMDIKAIKGQIETIEKENLAGIVAEYIVDGEPCPVCGSAHHPHIAQKLENLNLEEKRVLYSKINDSIDENRRLENVYKIELASYAKELKLKLEYLEELKNKLNGIDLTLFGEKKLKLEVEFNVLKFKIEKYNVEVKVTNEQLDVARAEMNKIDRNHVKISAELSKDSSGFESLIQGDNKIKGNLKAISIRYNNIKNELSIENIQGENNRIKEWDLEEDRERKVQFSLRQRINELDTRRNELEISKADINNNIENLKASGHERRKAVDNLIKTRNIYSENKNPNEYIVEVKHRINFLREAEASLKARFESERNTAQLLGEEKSNEEKNIFILKEALMENEKKILLSLEENNFKNEAEVLNSIIPKESMVVYEREIREYEDKFKATTDNINRINKKLNNESIDTATWNALNVSKKENEVAREENTKLIAGDQSRIERMEKDFEEIKILSKQKREEEHELSLLSDIMELISGNKFVEFAATNQLKYISLEASKRLREITRGRYALELDSNNEFVMRDDFNGGIRRSADTLSGGETFLTSLCLALSLSSNIQLKGNSPLEFFFLDEGFGTLDADLLEVVISSLERLRNDKLCVGIISHVEDLKSRVPIKLIVTPATIEGNGTKVSIEYS